MNEIVKLRLDNEMDLILAHRRSMKIAELCGLTHTMQTRFATAVSEITRFSIAHGKNSCLSLGISADNRGKKDIIAEIVDSVDLQMYGREPFSYAAKLVGNIEHLHTEDVFMTILKTAIPFPGTMTAIKINSFKAYFVSEPPISPYDEIRKKNIQLIELSEKLAESESKYRGLADNLPLLIFSINQNDTFSLTNKWLSEYLEAPLTAFNRKDLQNIVHKDDLDLILSEWAQSKKLGVRFRSELRVSHKGDYVWHILSIIPQKNDAGMIINWIGFFVDIDAHKRMEETLRDNSALRDAEELLKFSNTELSKKNHELEQFAFIASHDLQEPLRKIMLMTSQAKEMLTDEQQDKYNFHRIIAAADKMSNLISDVLNYSRVLHVESNFETISVEDVINEVLEDLDIAIAEKDAVITFGQMPWIKGLRFQIYQLFFNIIGNAIKFSSEKPVIEITSRNLTKSEAEEIDQLDSDKSYRMISIKDNGIGMDAKYSHQIFGMFKRLQNGGHGNGIGLALCKKIVENHHGLLQFSSVMGEGTTFKIIFPV